MDGSDRPFVDTPGDSNLNGLHDQIDLIGIDKEEVWFQKSGDNLMLKVLGTYDQMLFFNYYWADGNKFDKIRAGGEKLEHNDINALIAKMVRYTPNKGVDGTGINASELSDNLLDSIDILWTRYTDTGALL